jgi:ethanolamine utilization protein EutQ (cupin superfamily)
MSCAVSNAFATGQATVLTSALQIAPARADRKRLTLVMAGAVDVFIGGSAVTAGNGALLTGVKGSTLVLETTSAVFGISASSAVVSYIEEFA